MGFFKIVLIVVACVLVAFAVWNFVGVNAPNVNLEGLGDSPSQVYPNLRFSDSKISYQFVDDCTASKKKDILEAFSIIENETILKFYYSNKGQIEIYCSGTPPLNSNPKYFVAGEGGPYEVVEEGKYGVIKSAKLMIYEEESCARPETTLHEMFHVLGFTHSKNPKSIMYPVAECGIEIDKEMINQINEVYSQTPLPDLAIQNISALKNEEYLDFNISISNYGLVDAPDSYLDIYSNGIKLSDYSLGNIPIGGLLSFGVTNLKIDKNLKNFNFSVGSTSNELEFGNNAVQLTLN